jgi:hypothetical protein
VQWTIYDKWDLRSLVNAKAIKLVEATAVCDATRTFEQACENGTSRLDGDFDAAIDVEAAREFVEPM